jgi:hypothetical protein
VIRRIASICSKFGAVESARGSPAALSRNAAMYLALLVLPGGLVFALMAWLYRRWS